MRKALFFTALFSAFMSFSQEAVCSLGKSSFVDATRVDINDLKCLAKNSTKSNTLFYTFASYCIGCREHLPLIFNIAQNNDIKLYVLLVEPENNDRTKVGIDYINSRFQNVNFLILKDERNKGTRRRNSAFISEVSLKEKRFNPGLGVCIIINNNGEIKKITDNYADFRKLPNGEWETYESMLKREVFPYLTKK